MDVEVISLYGELDEEKIREYSRFKFGDPEVIEDYAKRLVELMQKYISKGKKYIIYATNKFPIRNYFKKNSLILAEKISVKFGIPLVVGEYKYHYDKDEFYDNNDKRIANIPVVKEEDKFVLNDSVVLMIDDSILTGDSLNVSVDVLKEMVNNITFFSVINLRGSKYSENEIGDFCYSEKGLSFLINLLNRKDYVITTQMLRTVDELSENQKRELFENINENMRNTLKKSFSEYIEKDLNL